MVAMLALILITALLAYRVSEKQGFDQMRDEASHQLDILAAAIDSEVTRHASIPSAVELNPDVLALLRAPPGQQAALQASANQFLQKLNDSLGGPVILSSTPLAGWLHRVTGFSPTTCSVPTCPTCPCFGAQWPAYRGGTMRWIRCARSRGIFSRCRFVMNIRTGR
jgi:hypothetical protein